QPYPRHLRAEAAPGAPGERALADGTGRAVPALAIVYYRDRKGEEVPQSRQNFATCAGPGLRLRRAGVPAARPAPLLPGELSHLSAPPGFPPGDVRRRSGRDRGGAHSLPCG